MPQGNSSTSEKCASRCLNDLETRKSFKTRRSSQLICGGTFASLHVHNSSRGGVRTLLRIRSGETSGGFVNNSALSESAPNIHVISPVQSKLSLSIPLRLKHANATTETTTKNNSCLLSLIIVDCSWKAANLTARRQSVPVIKQIPSP